MGCGCSRQAEGSVVDPKGSAPTESALASLRNLEDDALGGDDGVDQRTQHLAAAREKKKKERCVRSFFFRGSGWFMTHQLTLLPNAAPNFPQIVSPFKT
jgi:hypothetical protein